MAAASNKVILLLVFIIAAAFLTVPLTAGAAVNIPESSEEPVQEPESDISEIPVSMVRIIVTDFSVEGGGIIAGATSKITYKIKNTSDSEYVYSLLVIWGVDSSAPLYFSKTNQAYVPVIGPGQEVEVEFTAMAKTVDLTSVDSIPSSLTIHYNVPDQGDRTNTISIQLPVYRYEAEAPETVAPDQWQQPQNPAPDFLSSLQMQLIYVAGLIFCSVGISFVLLWKWRHRR